MPNGMLMAQDIFNRVYDPQSNSLRIMGDGVQQTPVAAPARHDSLGVQGTWAYDGTYFYWCVGPNEWIRFAAISDFEN